MCKISAVQGQANRSGSSCQLQLALPKWGYATDIAEPLRSRHRGFCPVLGHVSCGSFPLLHSRGPGHRSYLCLQPLPSSKLGRADTQVWASPQEDAWDGCERQVYIVTPHQAESWSMLQPSASISLLMSKIMRSHSSPSEGADRSSGLPVVLFPLVVEVEVVLRARRCLPKLSVMMPRPSFTPMVSRKFSKC